MGGTTCAASATSAIRSACKARAVWLMIGQTVLRDTSVSGPKRCAERSVISASNASVSRSSSRRTSGPRSIQTTAEEGRAIPSSPV
jgi:hypothetical protein